MEILSAAQHGASRAGKVPGVEEFAEGTWAVPMGLPGKFPGGSQAYSFAYVLDDFAGGLHVIDPGWHLPENLHRWEEFLHSIGRGFPDLATVIGTHLHYDHIGLAEEFVARSGAALVMHEREAEALARAAAALAAGDVAAASRHRRSYTEMTRPRLKEFGVPATRWEELLVPPERPTLGEVQRRVRGGEALPIPAREVRVLETPGHTGGHMCLVEEATEVFFSADHVLPGINSGVGLGGPSPTNPLADYLRSLERVAEFDSYTVAPGHEYRFRGLVERAERLRAHHLRRTRQVEAAMTDATTVWEIARKVTWSDGFENLRSYKLASALSQVAMHMEYVQR